MYHNLFFIYNLFGKIKNIIIKLNLCLKKNSKNIYKIYYKIIVIYVLFKIYKLFVYIE